MCRFRHHRGRSFGMQYSPVNFSSVRSFRKQKEKNSFFCSTSDDLQYVILQTIELRVIVVHTEGEGKELLVCSYYYFRNNFSRAPLHLYARIRFESIFFLSHMGTFLNPRAGRGAHIFRPSPPSLMFISRIVYFLVYIVVTPPLPRPVALPCSRAFLGKNGLWF